MKNKKGCRAFILTLGIFPVLFILACYAFSFKAYGDEVKKPKPAMYVNEDGKIIEPVKAILASLKGERILKCQPVDAQISKSGTSISLKANKKKK